MAVTDLELTPTFDTNVAAVVRVLLATQGLDVHELAPRVGMTKSTLYNRMSGKPWLASEIDRIADYFGVSPRVFYRPVSDLLKEAQNAKLFNGPDLRGLNGGRIGPKVPALRLLSAVPDLPE